MTWWPIPLFLIAAAALVCMLLNYRERPYVPPSDD